MTTHSEGVELHIIPSLDDRGGVGQFGRMLVARAMASATFNATGVWGWRLPIRPQLLRNSQS